MSQTTNGAAGHRTAGYPRKVVLILGSPRSGSTWLAKILDTHPSVLYLHEPFARLRHTPLGPLIRRLTEGGGLSAAERAELLDGVSHPFHAAVRPPFFPKDYTAQPAWLIHAAWSAAKMTGRGLGRFQRWAVPEDSRFDLLIKEVDWQGRVEAMIAGLRPDRVIFIFRHPCGVVASRLRGLKMGVIHGHDRRQWVAAYRGRFELLGLTEEDVLAMEPHEFYALDWVLLNEEYLRAAEKHGAATVIFKNLCERPLEEAARLFAHLGWELPRQTEGYVRASRRTLWRDWFWRWVGGRRHYYDLHREPTDATGNWRETLSARERRDILNIAASFRRMDFWADQGKGPTTPDRRGDSAVRGSAGIV